MVGIGILCSSITIILIPIMAPVGFCIMIVLQVISGLFEVPNMLYATHGDHIICRGSLFLPCMPC